MMPLLCVQDLVIILFLFNGMHACTTKESSSRCIMLTWYKNTLIFLFFYFLAKQISNILSTINTMLYAEKQSNRTVSYNAFA